MKSRTIKRKIKGGGALVARHQATALDSAFESSKTCQRAMNPRSRKGATGTVIAHYPWDDARACSLLVTVPAYRDPLPYQRWEVELVNP